MDLDAHCRLDCLGGFPPVLRNHRWIPLLRQDFRISWNL